MISKWGDIDPEVNPNNASEGDEGDKNYSRVFLLPQTHQSRKHFALNNLLIA